MTRIVHLSDLHFGRTEASLLEPLLAAVNGAMADLVVISGDLTQRARVWQFEQARAFIDRIEGPVLAVPGNHDTPLDNLFMRMLMPWRRYRAVINTDLQPVFRGDGFVVVGVNSVNRFAWQQGRLPSRAIARARAAFADAGEARRIVVLHHPLEIVPGDGRPVMDAAGRALDGFAAAGAEIVLSGHLHSTHIAPFTTHPGLLFVQAGTLSTRTRGEENSFNLLDLEADGVKVTAMRVDAQGSFRATDRATFRRGEKGWIRG